MTTTIVDALAALEADPADRARLARVAAELSAQGDPRGELMTAQLAGDDARAAALIDAMPLAIALGRFDHLEWGIGYVRRLTLFIKDRARVIELEPAWADPSLRLLDELVLTFKSTPGLNAITSFAEYLPQTIRRLRVGRLDEVYVDGLEGGMVVRAVAKLMSTVPRLEWLSLNGPLYFGTDANFEALTNGRLRALAHPGLTHLTLGGLSADLDCALLAISVDDLPKLRSLELTARFSHASNLDAICTMLANLRWLAQLTHLTLAFGRAHLGAPAIDALASGLGTRRLARLDVTGVSVTEAQRDQLAALCDELVAPDVRGSKAKDVVWVEHTQKPEWGRGRLVRRFEDKIDVEFDGLGKKVFRADAPALRIVDDD